MNMASESDKSSSTPISGTNTTHFQGKTVVVTGSSSGIGRVVAYELAMAGANLILHASQNRLGLSELESQLRTGERECTIIPQDLAETDRLESFVQSCWDWRNGVDIWINNAGADVLTGPAADWDFTTKLDRLWRVDVMGTIQLSRFIGQRMKHAGSGVILNIGWDQAWEGMAGDSGEMFATSKGAIMAFTRSLAKSLAPQVRVNCIAPGWIKTSWGETASDYWQQRACRESLRGRWGLPLDIAKAAKFLASPDADFITGQIMNVNGGFAGNAEPPRDT